MHNRWICSLVADAAWHFGTKYRSWCRIPAIELWKQPTIFRDLFVPFTQTSSSQTTGVPNKLYTVPNRILNDPVNEDEDENKNWRLTSRFFLVDSLAGANGEEAGIVRYLESLELRVELHHVAHPLGRHEQGPRHGLPAHRARAGGQEKVGLP